jgi:hypothetical protein
MIVVDEQDRMPGRVPHRALRRATVLTTFLLLPHVNLLNLETGLIRAQQTGGLDAHMANRILYLGASVNNLPAASVVLEKVGQATVLAAGDDAALSLLASHAALLAYSKESSEYRLRRLSKTEREEAVLRRLAEWSPRAVEEGIDWLFRSERRCLSLTAALAPGATRAARAEHTMTALHKIANEGRYGSLTLIEMLENLVDREALLLAELETAGGTAESSMHTQFSRAMAQELRLLGRPQYSQHLPKGEATRAALLAAPVPAIRSGLVARKIPLVDWKDGFVSTFSTSELESLAAKGNRLTILYPNSGDFLQDRVELTAAQLRREFDERLQLGAARLWSEHLNSLRLETALLRRAVYDAALGVGVSLASTLQSEIRQETDLLLSELGKHPSWLDGEFGPSSVTLEDAEKEVLTDVLFLSRLAAARHEGAYEKRYTAFYEFKVRR